METGAVVRFSGVLDMSKLDQMRYTLDPICTPCELDLTAVEFLDSTAITEFVTFARRLGARKVRVRGATIQFRRILELVGLTHLFDIVV